MESLELSLTQTRQEGVERSSQSSQTEREFSNKIKQLQEELSSERSERRKEREEASQQLKRVSLSSSQTQQVIKAKGKVAYLLTKVHFHFVLLVIHKHLMHKHTVYSMFMGSFFDVYCIYKV